MAWGAIAASIAAPVVANALFGKKGNTTVNQVPMETPEQNQARKGLLDFAKTGTYGSYTAGTPYSGSFGNFNLSPIEQTGMGNLSSLLSSSLPGSYTLGEDEIAKFLGDTYNPLQAGGYYDQYKKTAEMNATDSRAALKRDLSFNKNLAGSDTVNQFSDLERRNTQDINNTLAGIYENYVSRKASLIPQALQAGQGEEAIKQGRISSAFQYGGLERTLQNVLADKQYQDFLRQRGEQGQQVQALSNVSGSNTQFGVPSVSVPQTSSWDSLLQLISQAGGYGLGMKLAK